jgi:hypothetical protein
MKTFLLLLCFACLSITSKAQLTDMHWDTHGVGFKVASDVRITTNNSEEFTAEISNITLSIIPIQDGNLTQDHLLDATIEMAKGIGYDSVDGGDEVEIDNFKGYYVIGTKDGVNALIMSLLDTKSSTNLLVVIVYVNDFEDDAIEIANSFYAYSK